MASVIVTTNAFCRFGFPSLAEPKKLNEKDQEKYRLQAIFAKDNEYNLKDVGVIESHAFEIIDGLNEVCLQEFNFGVSSIDDVAALKDEVGVQFPPNFKDGDKIKKHDDQGRPIPGEFDERYTGTWLLNLTSNDQPAVIDHEEDAIDPKKVYAGCWGRVQVEISAYYKDRSPIVSIELLAVQYVYDDAQLGGGRPQRPDATKSFGKVAGGTASTRDAKRMGRPGERPAPQRPGRPEPKAERPAPSRPGERPAPSRPEPKAVEPQRELRALTETSIEDCRTVYQMTDDEIVNEGYGEWVEIAAKPAPSRPGRPSRPVPQRPTPKKPTGPVVIMNDDCEFTYEELRDEHGFSDDDIVNSGYGQFDYTNPDQ